MKDPRELVELRTACGCHRLFRLPVNTKDGVILPLCWRMSVGFSEFDAESPESVPYRREFKWRGRMTDETQLRIFEETP